MENINSNGIIENSVRNEITIDERATKTESTLGRKVSFIRESVSDSGVPDRKLSTTLDAIKRSSLRSQDAEIDLAQGKCNINENTHVILSGINLRGNSFSESQRQGGDTIPTKSNF